MRLFEAPSTLLSVIALLLTSSQQTNATPFSKIADVLRHQLEERTDDLSLQNNTLVERTTCQAGYFNCGYYGQVCCMTGSETCGTNNNNEAVCKAGTSGATATGAGSWQTFTSTWVDTVTKTSVYSSWVPGTATVAVAGSATCTPNWANNESPCGPICCSSGQYCFDLSRGICTTAGNGGFTTTGVGYSAPLRPTTSGGVIITQTISPTTTIPFQTPVATGAQNGTITPTGSSSHLSGGAIAGIVIGVLAGLALLFLICFLCCLKAGFDGILALFGMGKKSSRKRVVEEEYVETHRRHGSHSAGSDRRWYGSAGARPSRPPPPPKKAGGFGGLLGATAGLGGLALALGLKRKHDKKHEEKSDYSSNYGSSYYDYSSSASSDDRTRRSSRR